MTGREDKRIAAIIVFGKNSMQNWKQQPGLWFYWRARRLYKLKNTFFRNYSAAFVNPAIITIAFIIYRFSMGWTYSYATMGCCISFAFCVGNSYSEIMGKTCMKDITLIRLLVFDSVGFSTIQKISCYIIRSVLLLLFSFYYQKSGLSNKKDNS